MMDLGLTDGFGCINPDHLFVLAGDPDDGYSIDWVAGFMKR
jgi:hypothetical protein